MPTSDQTSGRGRDSHPLGEFSLLLGPWTVVVSLLAVGETDRDRDTESESKWGGGGAVLVADASQSLPTSLISCGAAPLSACLILPEGRDAPASVRRFLLFIHCSPGGSQGDLVVLWGKITPMPLSPAMRGAEFLCWSRGNRHCRRAIGGHQVVLAEGQQLQVPGDPQQGVTPGNSWP